MWQIWNFRARHFHIVATFNECVLIYLECDNRVHYYFSKITKHCKNDFNPMSRCPNDPTMMMSESVRRSKMVQSHIPFAFNGAKKNKLEEIARCQRRVVQIRIYLHLHLHFHFHTEWMLRMLLLHLDEGRGKQYCHYMPLTLTKQYTILYSI